MKWLPIDRDENGIATEEAWRKYLIIYLSYCDTRRWAVVMMY